MGDFMGDGRAYNMREVCNFENIEVNEKMPVDL